MNVLIVARDSEHLRHLKAFNQNANVCTFLSGGTGFRADVLIFTAELSFFLTQPEYKTRLVLSYWMTKVSPNGKIIDLGGVLQLAGLAHAGRAAAL